MLNTEPVTSDLAHEEGAIRGAILDAAAVAFMTKGYAATSIDDVAEILHATKGKVYHHYRKKAYLFYDVHKRALDIDLAAVQRAAFADDMAFFAPIRKPDTMDWLAQHQEGGQTVEEYRVALSALKPTPLQKAVCVLPLGQFNAGSAPSLEKLREYCTAFFGMETRILEPVTLDKVPAKRRTNTFNKMEKLQLLTTDILNWLPSRNLHPTLTRPHANNWSAAASLPN